jgi:hypothetical protein
MLKFTPRTLSALRGDDSTRESDAKKHGRRFPNVPSSLRSLRMPCSGRTFPVPHFYTIGSARVALHAMDNPYWSTNSTENNSISSFCSSESFVCEGIVVCVYRALYDISVLTFFEATQMSNLHLRISVLGS